MYTELATQLGADSEEVSQAIDIRGANAALVESVVYDVGSTGGVVIHLQTSNDLENWEDSGSNSGILALGYSTFEAKNLATSYVRLRYAPEGAGTYVIAAGLNLAEF